MVLFNVKFSETLFRDIKQNGIPNLMENITVNMVLRLLGGADQVQAPYGHCAGGHNPNAA